MIYNIVQFFNENDLLDMRLDTMGSVVDRFVVVESIWTFRGQYKGLKFDRQRFADWEGKIIYHPVLEDIVPISERDPGSEQQTRDREIFQRRAAESLVRPLDEEDIVIVTDADEILTPMAVRSYNPDRGIIAAELQETIFFLNCLFPRYPTSPTLAPGLVLNEAPITELRNVDFPDGIIHNAGWHFRFSGPLEDIRFRLGASLHWKARFEFNPLNLVHSGQTPRHLVEDPATLIAVNGTMPEYVRSHEGELLGKGLLG